eukprot:6480108-Amphidinium_carterae.1
MAAVTNCSSPSVPVRGSVSNPSDYLSQNGYASRRRSGPWNISHFPKTKQDRNHTGNRGRRKEPSPIHHYAACACCQVGTLGGVRMARTSRSRTRGCSRLMLAYSSSHWWGCFGLPMMPIIENDGRENLLNCHTWKKQRSYQVSPFC